MNVECLEWNGACERPLWPTVAFHADVVAFVKCACVTLLRRAGRQLLGAPFRLACTFSVRTRLLSCRSWNATFIYRHTYLPSHGQLYFWTRDLRDACCIRAKQCPGNRIKSNANMAIDSVAVLHVASKVLTWTVSGYGSSIREERDQDGDVMAAFN